jgi:hypothetical protein
MASEVFDKCPVKQKKYLIVLPQNGTIARIFPYDIPKSVLCRSPITSQNFTTKSTIFACLNLFTNSQP